MSITSEKLFSFTGITSIFVKVSLDRGGGSVRVWSMV